MILSRDSLSVADKLLLAAYQLEENGVRPFTAEDLVVSAWRAFPDAFGLAGYRGGDGGLAYPDSNRVFAEIMGSKPVRARGLLSKVGSKRYQLTEAGREYVRTLRKPDGDVIQKAGLERATEHELKRLLSSNAFDKFRNGRTDDLTFFDASAFWGISSRSSAIELQGRVTNFLRIVGTASEIVGSKSATFEHGGAPFTRRDLDMLLNLHKQLTEKFDQELAIIRRRSDRS